jgi:hypothetical protein
MSTTHKCPSGHLAKRHVGEAGWGDDFKGITKDLAVLREDPRHQLRARWLKHGKRTPLMNAILKMRALQRAARQSLLASSPTK